MCMPTYSFHQIRVRISVRLVRLPGRSDVENKDEAPYAKAVTQLRKFWAALVSKPRCTMPQVCRRDAEGPSPHI